MKELFYKIAFLLMAALLLCKCGDDNSNSAKLNLSIDLTGFKTLKRAQNEATEGGELYDLSRDGMIGKICVSAPDMEEVSVIFPQSAEEMADGEIDIELEIEPGKNRLLDGAFFSNSDGVVSAFKPLETLDLTLNAGEERDVILALTELNATTLLMITENNDVLTNYKKIFAVENSLGIIFPPADIIAGEEIKLENIPVGLDLWFRLEDKDGQTIDLRTGVLCSVAEEEASCPLALPDK